MEGSDLLRTFERELRNSTEQMQSILLEVEQLQRFEQAAPLMQEAYRLAHSLKGASRVVGLFPIEEIAHALEDQIQRLLKNEDIPDAKETSTFLRAVDAFISGFEAFMKGEVFESSGLVQELGELQKAGEESPVAPPVRELPSSAPSSERKATKREEYVTVPSRQIDELFRRVEEAFLIESRINSLLSATDSLFQEMPGGKIPDAWHRQYGTLKNDAARLHFVLMHFHDIVRLFRMVPMKRLRVAAQKAVRDLSLTLGKPVSFTFRGEHQMLDASLLESLQEPVLHLIRNAVDHGIELPEERRQRGKTAEGHLTVEATVTGGFLNLLVIDDGRGISTDEIRKKALDLQIIPAEEAEHLSETEWLEFLFRPGFSTAGTLSSISGRGIGMDIVRRRIQDLGGYLQVSTRSGIGTTFTLQLPIGLLTPRVLLVRCGDHQAAIPTSDIERVFSYDPGRVRQVNGTTMIEWNGTPIRLESLASHLGWTSSGASAHVVLLNRQETRKGMLVDEILAEIEQVAFPPPWNLRGIPYLSGVIVMGDGSLVPVAETRDLMRKAEERTDVEMMIPAPDATYRRRTVLVVDDSPTIVALHRSVLKNAGYQVLTAENGRDAWDILLANPVDLLLTDIEMPGMNGLDLIRQVRGDSTRNNLPVVVVSQYGASTDLRKAADAGADRYIVKSAFNPQKLLETIQELLME